MSNTEWFCQTCRHSDFQPLAKVSNEGYSEAWGVRQFDTESVLGCPQCGGESVVRRFLCAECGLAPAVKGDDLCQPCRETEAEAEAQFWMDHEERVQEKVKQDWREVFIDAARGLRRAS